MTRGFPDTASDGLLASSATTDTDTLPMFVPGRLAFRAGRIGALRRFGNRTDLGALHILCINSWPLMTFSRSEVLRSYSKAVYTYLSAHPTRPEIMSHSDTVSSIVPYPRRDHKEVVITGMKVRRSFQRLEVCCDLPGSAGRGIILSWDFREQRNKTKRLKAGGQLPVCPPPPGAFQCRREVAPWRPTATARISAASAAVTAAVG